MIVRGNAVRDWGLGPHLTSAKNGRVSFIGSRGVGSRDVASAIKDLDAFKRGMQATKNLAHFHIDPAGSLNAAGWDRAWAALEREYGLQGCPYVEVEHEKKGRVHRHRVYSRLDLETGKTVQLSHNFARNEKLGHELALAFGEELVPGRHSGAIIATWGREGKVDAIAALQAAQHRLAQDGRKPGDRTTSRVDLQQEERTGVPRQIVVRLVGSAWRDSGDAVSFRAALQTEGLELARGAKGGLVVVDRAGGTHSVARLLRSAGVTIRAADVTARFPDLLRALPQAAGAREYQRQRGAGVDKVSMADRADRRTEQRHVDAIVLDCWRRSDDGETFRQLVESSGLALARGDRRRVVIISPDGRIQSLTRLLKRADQSLSSPAVAARSKELEPLLRPLTDVLREVQAAIDARGGSTEELTRRPPRFPDASAVAGAQEIRREDGQRRRRARESAIRRDQVGAEEERLRQMYRAERQAKQAQARETAAAARQEQRQAIADLTDRFRTERQFLQKAFHGPMRTIVLALHQALSSSAVKERIGREKLPNEGLTPSRWVRRDFSYGIFLRRQSSFDQAARRLVNRELQRALHRSHRPTKSRIVRLMPNIVRDLDRHGL
jgi:hypothetical protein